MKGGQMPGRGDEQKKKSMKNPGLKRGRGRGRGALSQGAEGSPGSAAGRKRTGRDPTDGRAIGRKKMKRH